ncbi:O-acetyl-ADP-ribose deacetylase [Hoyosella sp. YIM 151337]|uniref:O-acetyl-ADP-ribose deacetylase n=1 Tax=Hoyosella sp. YIM 151337 TaxID=2992742 RepID=UPI0035A83289
MHIEVHQGDITRVAVDAIVNAANSSLLGGGGVDGAIHRAGGPEILRECRKLRDTVLLSGLPAGNAVATTAGKLPARWVIHTVGPVFSQSEDRSHLLRSAYRSSVEVATDLGAESIAFPLISAGAYGWPLQNAALIAVESVLDSTAKMRVRLVAYSPSAADALRHALDQLGSD